MSSSKNSVGLRKRDRKNVLILYTGGTMGMKKGSDGALAPVAGYLTDQIQNNFAELHREEMPRLTIKEYYPLIDSSCMGVSGWVRMVTDIANNYNKFDGFVVIMGTDTMAYASSAVSFMLENLNKPVIFTGSQVPFCEVYSDARRNLIGALIFASRNTFREVCMFFNDRLLRSNRAVKVNSVSLSAFDTPNYPPLARLGAYVEEFHELALPTRHGELIVHKALDAKIMVLKLVPGFDDMAIMTMVNYSTDLRAIVFEMYGTGNGPSHKETLINAIRKARKKGIVCVALSQCLHGGVTLESYSMGLEFKNAGMISGGDMTVEACTTKLAYLWGLVTEEVKDEDGRGLGFTVAEVWCSNRENLVHSRGTGTGSEEVDEEGDVVNYSTIVGMSNAVAASAHNTPLLPTSVSPPVTPSTNAVSSLFTPTKETAKEEEPDSGVVSDVDMDEGEGEGAFEEDEDIVGRNRRPSTTTEIKMDQRRTYKLSTMGNDEEMAAESSLCDDSARSTGASPFRVSASEEEQQQEAAAYAPRVRVSSIDIDPFDITQSLSNNSRSSSATAAPIPKRPPALGAAAMMQRDTIVSPGAGMSPCTKHRLTHCDFIEYHLQLSIRGEISTDALSARLRRKYFTDTYASMGNLASDM